MRDELLDYKTDRSIQPRKSPNSFTENSSVNGLFKRKQLWTRVSPVESVILRQIVARI
jgi:hypothetical protein